MVQQENENRFARIDTGNRDTLSITNCVSGMDSEKCSESCFSRSHRSKRRGTFAIMLSTNESTITIARNIKSTT